MRTDSPRQAVLVLSILFCSIGSSCAFRAQPDAGDPAVRSKLAALPALSAAEAWSAENLPVAIPTNALSDPSANPSAAPPAGQPAQRTQKRDRVAVDNRPTTDSRLILGFGLTVDPNAFLLTGQVDVPFRRGTKIGPLLQVGLSDDETLIAGTINLKREVELEVDIDGERWFAYPFGQVGLGVAYLEKERGPRDVDDTGFLFNFGGGVSVPIDDQFSIGSTILFNFVPGEIVDEKFFFSWQILQFELHF